MASFTFEDGDQTAATLFAPGDTLTFRDAHPMAVEVTRAADTITLRHGGKALTFSEASLDWGGAALFNWGGGLYHLLELGSARRDDLSYYTVRDKAVWTFGGDDHVTLGVPGRMALHTGDGNDRVDIDLPFLSLPLYQTGAWLIDGGAGDDVIGLHWATGPLTVHGGSGADTIEGGISHDHLFGNLPGVAGNDGDDSIGAGAGNDYVHAGAGDDIVYGEAGNDRLYGGAGDDLIHGGDGNDHLQGNKGSDLLRGGSGNDTVRGGAGDDLLSGNEGQDLLMGDDGDDVLRGGIGADTLVGGAGADRFVYLAGDAPEVTIGGAVETIFDFQNGIDLIGLNFLVRAVHVTDAAHATIAFAAGGHVNAVQVGADTWLHFAGDGGAAYDSAIRLVGVDAGQIDPADFL